MGKRNYWIFSIALWVAVAAGAAINDEDDALPGEKFFRQLPESERPDYLSFELGRGYVKRSSSSNVQLMSDDNKLKFPDALDIPEDLMEKFEALEIPDNFTENLFKFVQTEFELDMPNIRTLILMRKLCFEDGTCIDLEDIGTHCCPF